MSYNHKSVDEILAEANASLNSAYQSDEKIEYESQSFLKQSWDKAAGLTKQAGQSIQNTCDYVWNDWARPVTRFVDPAVKAGGWASHAYWNANKAIFNFCAHKKDDAGERSLSWKRAAVAGMALLTLNSALIIGAPFALFTNLDNIRDFGHDAVLYNLTKQTETLYLTGSETIDDEANIFSVSACRTLNCSERDTIHMKLRESPFISVNKLLTERDIFIPENIHNAIPGETAKCDVTYFGTYNKLLKLRPVITDIQCYLNTGESTPPPPNPSLS